MKNWFFNWKLGLLVVAFMFLVSNDHMDAMFLLGTLCGGLIISVVTGFDESLRIK